MNYNDEKAMHDEIRNIVSDVKDLYTRSEDIKYEKYQMQNIRRSYIGMLSGLTTYEYIYQESMDQMNARPAYATIVLKMGLDERNKTLEGYRRDIEPLNEEIMEMDEIENEAKAQSFDQAIFLKQYLEREGLTAQEQIVIKAIIEKNIGDLNELNEVELKERGMSLKDKQQELENEINSLTEEINNYRAQRDKNEQDCQNAINTGVANGITVQEYGSTFLGKIRDDYQNIAKSININTRLMQDSSKIRAIQLEQYKIEHLIQEKEFEKQENIEETNEPVYEQYVTTPENDNSNIINFAGNPDTRNITNFRQNVKDAISDVKISDIDEFKEKVNRANQQNIINIEERKAEREDKDE